MACAVVEFGVWVLVFQYFDQWIYIETLEGSISDQTRSVMPNKQLIIKKPYIGFCAGTACSQAREQWDTAPVVIVGMAGYGEDVPGEIGRVPGEAF